MDACRTEVPPEVTFADRVRVACHLYPPSSDGTPRVVPVAGELAAAAKSPT